MIVDKWQFISVVTPHHFLGRALTMVRFVGKGHLNDQTKIIALILVRHLPWKSDISRKVRYFRIFLFISYKFLAMKLQVLLNSLQLCVTLKWCIRSTGWFYQLNKWLGYHSHLSVVDMSRGVTNKCFSELAGTKVRFLVRFWSAIVTESSQILVRFLEKWVGYDL